MNYPMLLSRGTYTFSRKTEQGNTYLSIQSSVVYYYYLLLLFISANAQTANIRKDKISIISVFYMRIFLL